MSRYSSVEVQDLNFKHTDYIHLQAMELMFVEALVKADGYLKISSLIHTPAEYWKVSRLYILCSYLNLLC